MDVGEAEPRYNGAAVAGAVLATLLFPLIALIAALILLGNERSPQRRSQLRIWAWASGGLMLVGVLLFVLAFVTVGSGSGAF
jgi:drug/metabolite transporter (DMT)-like permease